MAQAVLASIPQSNSVQEAAAQIVALINASPRSPRVEEIEAVIARVVPSQETVASDTRLLEWRETVAAYRAAVEAAVDDAVVGAALNALDTHSRAMWAMPVRTFADLLLRAEIAQEWNTPGKIGDPEYPRWVLQHKDPSIDDLALAHVLQAILALGACNPSLPAPASPPLLPKIRKTVSRVAEAFDALGPLHAGPEEQAAEAEVDRAQAALKELEEQVPSPPRSFGDLVALAEITRCGADVGFSHWADDCGDRRWTLDRKRATGLIG